MRLRKDVYNKLLNMPAKWFDIPKHNPGAIAARLATDANLVNNLTSNNMAV